MFLSFIKKNVFPSSARFSPLSCRLLSFQKLSFRRTQGDAVQRLPYDAAGRRVGGGIARRWVAEGRAAVLLVTVPRTGRTAGGRRGDADYRQEATEPVSRFGGQARERGRGREEGERAGRRGVALMPGVGVPGIEGRVIVRCTFCNPVWALLCCTR